MSRAESKAQVEGTLGTRGQRKKEADTEARLGRASKARPRSQERTQEVQGSHEHLELRAEGGQGRKPCPGRIAIQGSLPVFTEEGEETCSLRLGD